MVSYLIKPGELVLKGGNRAAFERILKRNLNALLGDTGARIEIARGRFYLHCPENTALDHVEDALDHLLGIAGWARTRICEKEPRVVLETCVEIGREFRDRGLRTFKIEARRTDKSFPLDSYGIRCQGGKAILEALPELAVDVHTPRGIIEVEIRERAYVYGMEKKGLRGLPVGTAGRGMLLLSGGIDSPVAGYLMASRGMHIDGVYFHAYPYTSDEARRKVLDLARILGRYTLGMRLYTVGFTPVQLRIRDGAPEAWTTILLRMAMMECAEKLAKKRHDRCLITGESLSQVASQTIENISCIQSRTVLPVLRPLIGMDKDRIIHLGEAIGTYRTSILPYEDCCVLFSPPHPVLRGDPAEAGRLYESLALGDLIDSALRENVMERCGYPQEP
ncbi:MAG: tRNA 4-thiouridine(8) synthase ThiI [Spirochaetaceae bacterium]|jgi:thiamine biosynthesis protein ThiI|nr:tRNA 4-thiouridine(8) synthase ThiI [Spirochaetaceae bacterium]